MKCSMLVLAGLAVLMCDATAAYADTITFTETTTASGSLDGTRFTDALVTLMLTGDTANVQSVGVGLLYVPGSATVSVAGDGSDTFTDKMVTAVNQGLPGAGIGDFTNDLTILFILNSQLSDYGLTSSIGPLSGLGGFNPRTLFPTIRGTFDMTSISIITFTAVDSTSTATPEPGSLPLLGVGLLGLMGMGMQRKQLV